MVGLFKYLFGGWNTTPVPLPCPEIHLRIIPSSDILHKHDTEKHFTVTLEVIYQCNKLFTILIYRTLLSPWGSPFNGGGLKLVDTETSMLVKQKKVLTNHGCNTGDIPINYKASERFVTLMPGFS
jgi:hypothetical protein